MRNKDILRLVLKRKKALVLPDSESNGKKFNFPLSFNVVFRRVVFAGTEQRAFTSAGSRATVAKHFFDVPFNTMLISHSDALMMAAVISI